MQNYEELRTQFGALGGRLLYACLLIPVVYQCTLTHNGAVRGAGHINALLSAATLSLSPSVARGAGKRCERVAALVLAPCGIA